MELLIFRIEKAIASEILLALALRAPVSYHPVAAAARPGEPSKGFSRRPTRSGLGIPEI